MQTVHVPSFGSCEAKPACDLAVGDVIIHSFGIKSDVLKIVSQTAKSVVVNIKERDSGYQCDKRYLKNRLVPVKVSR